MRNARTIAVTRRSALAGGGTVCLAMLSQQAFAATSAPEANTVPVETTFTKDSDTDGVASYKGIHEGKGAGNVKFFRFDGAPAPANFLIYDLPPGSSEGVHVHYLDNRNGEGSFDEYYYIVSGAGHMQIDGKMVPVIAGDHVHTPLEIAHGIENTSATQNLKIFLTFIKRGDEPDPAEDVRPMLSGG